MKLGKLDLKKITTNVMNVASEKAPTIMCIGAAFGLGATVFLALKAKPKVDDILAQMREDVEEIKTNDGMSEEAKKTELRQVNVKAVKDVAIAVAPAAAAGGVTIGLIFGANHINTKRIAKLTTDLGAAYELSMNAKKAYQKATKEVVGEKKEEQIRQQAAKECVTEKYTGVGIIETGHGDMLYMDACTGRFFRSSKTAIENACNLLNKQMIDGEECLTLNALYYELGLPGTGLAEKVGFNVNSGLIQPEYTYTEAPNGDHCIIVDFDVNLNFWHRY